MNSETSESRRSVLRYGLAGVAGLVAGHSIFTKGALAAERTMQVTIPTISATAGTLSATSKTQVLQAIAPVLTGIVEAAGITLSPTQLTAMKNNMLSRGTIQLPAGTTNSAYTIGTFSTSGMTGIR